MYETVQEEGGPKGPLSQAVVDAYEGKQTDPVEQKAVVQFKKQNINNIRTDAFGIASPETVENFSKEFDKTIGSKIRKAGNALFMDEEGGPNRLTQEIMYYGGKLFFGGVDENATKQEFDRLSSEKQKEFINAIKKRKEFEKGKDIRDKEHKELMKKTDQFIRDLEIRNKNIQNKKNIQSDKQ